MGENPTIIQPPFIIQNIIFQLIILHIFIIYPYRL